MGVAGDHLDYNMITISRRPPLLVPSHRLTVNVRQRGHSVILVTTLRNVIMLVFPVAQDSAQLGLDSSTASFFCMHKRIAA